MALFEFECSHCGGKTEIIQKVKDPAPQCSCGSGEMKKLFPSRTSFILKGTGWYKTDYASKRIKNK